MNRRSLIAAGIFPIFYGCANKSKFLHLSLDEYAKTVYLPALGDTTIANIGERMIATLRIALVPAIETADEYALDLPYSNEYLIATILPAGIYTFVGKDIAGGSYFKSKVKIPIAYKLIKNPIKKDSYEKQFGGVYISASGATSVFFIWEGRFEPSDTYAAPNVKYTNSLAEIDLPQENLQKELIYSGLSQSTITLRYREYWKGISRPDYFQEVKYDLSQGRAIGFKESRFEIVSASNTSISYRATAHLK
jgi:hypothetical protein